MASSDVPGNEGEWWNVARNCFPSRDLRRVGRNTSLAFKGARAPPAGTGTHRRPGCAQQAPLGGWWPGAARASAADLPVTRISDGARAAEKTAASCSQPLPGRKPPRSRAKPDRLCSAGGGGKPQANVLQRKLISHRSATPRHQPPDLRGGGAFLSGLWRSDLSGV